MTELLYETDAYLASVAAEVTRVESEPDGGRLTLSRTVFHPLGGGQPADTGILVHETGDTLVHAVISENGIVWHHVQPGVELRSGDAVRAAIDWDRRYLLMQTHTTAHILSAVAFDLYGACVTGSNLAPGELRMDFEGLPAGCSSELESAIRAEIEADRAVNVSHLSRSEAATDASLVRTKTSLIPLDADPVRIVSIVGLDRQADSGTHVAQTCEIPVTTRVTRVENKGKGFRRVRVVLVRPS